MTVDQHTYPEAWATCRLLGMAARLDERRINRTITHLGLTKGSLEVLETVAERHTCKVSELGALLCVSPQSMGRVVQRLQSLGLLRKQRGRDGRTADIELTQNGGDILSAAEELLQDLAHPDADPEFRSNLAHLVGDLKSLDAGKSAEPHIRRSP